MTKQSLESSPSISVSTGNEPVNCTACELDEFLCNLAEGYLPCVSSELCTSSPALGEAFLPTYYSDTSQSAQSKSMSIASRSYQRGRKMVVFHGFQSLQMSRSSTDDRGEDSSMSSQAASLAKTSALPEKVLESTGNDPACGLKWQESFAKYDPVTRSWRTRQHSLLGGLDAYSETWPKWGWMRAGACSALPTLARPICGSESGYWPTPTANNYEQKDLGKLLQRREKLKLEKKNGNGFGLTLGNAVRLYPTPTASMAKGSSAGALIRRNGRSREWDRLDYLVEGDARNGRLNPDFVCWLMNWPRGSERIHDDSKTLSGMQSIVNQEAVRIGHARRQWMFCEAKILRSLVYGESDDKRISDEIGYWKTPCFTKESLLRTLRSICELGDPPQGSQLAQQRLIEFDDAVRFVSYLFASQSGRHQSQEIARALHHLREAIISAWAVLHPSDTIQAAWKSMSRETQDWCILAACGGLWVYEWPGVDRLTVNCANRGVRIRALGNGQVPLCKATAWNILYGRV